MKAELCAAFCHDLTVTQVPAGLAVGTAFERSDGDRIGFFILGPDSNELYRVQDDGMTIPYLQACGADLDIASRNEAFEEILREHDIRYDPETSELSSGWIPRDMVAKAGLRLVSVLMRLQDLLLMTRDRAENTWLQEVKRDLEQASKLKGFSIAYDQPVLEQLSDLPADVVLKAENRQAVALFWGTGDAKVGEALLLQALAKFEFNTDLQVILLLEKDSSVSKKWRLRADNHLIVPRYRQAERDALARIVQAVVGEQSSFH